MSKTLKLFILTAFLLYLSFFISQEAQAEPCANVPLSGNYNVTTSCYFSGTVDGIENGNLIVDSGKTLTINAGQTIVWNPGRTVLIHGAIAINVGSPGGQLRKAYLWLIDADDDDYPSTSTQIASASQPANGKRRSDADFTNKFTYINDIIVDSDDNDHCSIHLCGEDEDGVCVPIAAGDYNLSVCKKCDGISIDEVDITDYIEDSEGSNTCATSCHGCLNGSCVNFANGSKDEEGSNLCNATHYRCNGSGACTAPCSTATGCFYIGGYKNCTYYCGPTWGMCACAGDCPWAGCADCQPCGSCWPYCKCYDWLYDPVL